MERHLEVSGGVVKKYYTAGGQRSGATLHWLLSDHHALAMRPSPFP